MTRCTQGHSFELLNCNLGHYIGTEDAYGIPQCRASGYYRTKKEAEMALKTGAFSGDAEENDYCNGGRGCYKQR